MKPKMIEICIIQATITRTISFWFLKFTTQEYNAIAMALRDAYISRILENFKMFLLSIVVEY